MQILQLEVQKNLPEIISFEGHNLLNSNEPRVVQAHICWPNAPLNENTGSMLVSHNWGGTWEMCWEWCKVLANKFNLICIDTDYYQSGWVAGDPTYDHGFVQAMDCLRALYEVRNYLIANKLPFNRQRNYAAGASGGGNISQMVNKFAPHTFGCIIDLCGMPGLTDNIAYGVGRLNAGYSCDPQAENYLAKHMQEIRDFGNLEHLKIQYECNPGNQVVIVHGVDDDYCSCADKAKIFANMLAIGFKPEGYFITPGMVDGLIVLDTGHSIGDRAYIIAKYGQRFIAEHGKFVKLVEADDFERKSKIIYPVTGGVYCIDYASGAPFITFTAEK